MNRLRLTKTRLGYVHNYEDFKMRNINLLLVLALLFTSIGCSAESPLTCLLYTSPSPRDRTRSRMPSSA